MVRLYPKDNRPKPWIYISGPISIGDQQQNAARACKLFKTLLIRGAQPICPHWSVLQQFVAPLTWDQWLAYDLPLVEACDALVWDQLQCPGESKGSLVEWNHADAHEIPTFSNFERCLEAFGL
jgi:hypothetical protein